MPDKDNKAGVFEDLMEMDNHVLTIREIEHIAKYKTVFDQYESKYSGRLYSKILLSLTHESYDEDKAKHLWDGIVKHYERMERILGRKVGVVVSALDYMQNITYDLQSPRLIEMEKSMLVVNTTLNDELTGLYLRDVFDMVLIKEVETSMRLNSPLSLLMIDIDDFKVVNDTYGHQTGDQVLHDIGEVINKCIRTMDFAARYGGEELSVIMPGTTLEEAGHVADRIRRAIESLKFDDFSVTVSIGVAQITSDIESPKDLVEASDKALYEAKETGKNKVVHY